MAPQLNFESCDNQLSKQNVIVNEKAKEILRSCEKNNLLWLSTLLNGEQGDINVTCSTEKEKTIDVCDDDGWTGLHWASRHNNVNMLSSLLKAGADVNSKTATGDTALSISALYGNTPCAMQLIRTEKCVIDTVNKGGFTPLMYASRFNHIELAEALIGAGAAVNTHNPVTGDDSLSYASKNGHQHIIKMLINAGAVERENSSDFKNAMNSAKDDETRELLLKETRWFLRKPLLIALTEGDVIESSNSKCKQKTDNVNATFKPPSTQEMVFFNLYREIAMYL